MKREIETREDVEFLVDSFYTKVKKDELIGHFFTEVVELSWEKHIPVMINFWSTILLGDMSYKGNPMLPHIALDKKSQLNPIHFERWHQLFHKTLDENFKGKKVEKAKKRAQLMGDLMIFKIEQSRDKHFIQ